MNREDLTLKEQFLFGKYGGGEEAERVIKNRRAYYEQYSAIMKDYGREKARLHYLPKKERHNEKY